jgi:hypothetical protein
MDNITASNRRYTLIGWGILFIWIGAISFIPGEHVPFGVGVLGIGVILLGINMARYLINQIPVNGADITLGVIALALGGAELFRSLLPIPIGLIVIGVILLIRSTLSPKTE